MKNKMKKIALATTTALTAMSFSNAVQAEMFWSDNSFSVLQGQDHSYFSDEGSKQTVLTYEHASGHNWGGLFMFFDRTKYNDLPNNPDDTYGEISPDLSLSYLTGADLSFGPIKDITLSGTYEFGSNMDNFLYGVGAKWDIPGFQFFSSTVYYADNEATENDIQLTLAWGYQLPIDAVEINFGGYIDWSSAEDDHASDFHFNPQLLVNVGKYMGITKSKLEVGIEYSYWNNKYGLTFLDDESVVSIMAKFHL